MYKLELDVSLSTFETYYFDSSSFTGLFKKLDSTEICELNGQIAGCYSPIITGHLGLSTKKGVSEAGAIRLFGIYVQAFLSDLLCSLHFQQPWYQVMGQVFALFDKVIAVLPSIGTKFSGEPNSDGTVFERVFVSERAIHSEQIQMTIKRVDE